MGNKKKIKIALSKLTIEEIQLLGLDDIKSKSVLCKKCDGTGYVTKIETSSSYCDGVTISFPIYIKEKCKKCDGRSNNN